VFARVRGAKNIGDGADILVGIDPLGAIGIEGADARGQRAAVVPVEQYARDYRRCIDRPGIAIGAVLGLRGLSQPVHCSDAALAMQVLAHLCLCINVRK